MEETEIRQHFHSSSKTTCYCENSIELTRTFKKNTYMDKIPYLCISRDILAQQQLIHEVLVPYSGFQANEDSVEIYRKYVEGRTISQIVTERGGLHIIDVLKIMQQLSEAVSFLHQRKIYLQTLSADNVIVSDDDRAKIVDFGIMALSMDHLDRPNNMYQFAMQITQEQQFSASLDVFHLGILCYYMYCGKLPVNDNNISELKIEFDETPESSIEQELENLIRHMLITDPRSRPCSFEISQALKYILSQVVVEPKITHSESGSINNPYQLNIPVYKARTMFFIEVNKAKSQKKCVLCVPKIKPASSMGKMTPLPK